MSHLFGAAGAVGSFVPLPGSSAIEKYVDGTNGNDNNSGDTALTAYQTIQKAVDEISKYLGSEKVIYVADDTYNIASTLILPTYANGRLTIQGNTTTPANVLVDAGVNPITVLGHGGSFDLGGQVSQKNSCELVIDGIEFSGGLINAWIDNAVLTVKYCRFTDSLVNGITAIGVPNILFENDADGDSVISAASGTDGIICANLGSVSVNQDLTISGFKKGFNMQDSSKLELTDPRSINITLRDTADAVGIDMGQGSALNGDASISVTGNSRATDYGIRLSGSNGLFDSVGGGTWAFEDLGVGLSLENNSFLNATTGTFTYTNVTTDAIVDSTSSFIHDNNLDTTPVFKNELDSVDGRDYRAIDFDLMYN